MMNANPELPGLRKEVVDHFCKLAVETDYHDIRKVLLEALRNRADEANARFIAYARQAKKPAIRRRALINLSLMKCRDAKDVVLQGLRDPSREVRVAAAFCAGLYQDQDVLTALKHFFEVHNFNELA